ncbi:Flp pilus assembly protein TadG [Pseudarthrobacter phenanthrenivorans Sphe3]|uniref:Flp pilus assembly protein TadG n=1 Tax=Pseudarthrobacter phenanthrenivorans (strain DSM 18606 / JCM 16027 / LMG 23796 / Sphe3) TaxID=930171 RepID=F0M9W3_PSEPM|nr:TadE/TadG family type IV pilus assembly protein [Pseudarthrobacter phenanthrenivorans]ADX73893.1 Flp pilus assembly protein TadG [Pseudarthrobacter phenanthrenivorans Sphe3]
MRRVKDGNAIEGGAISVIVAILMVALLGFVAIAVDIGVIYSERAQLQNGADASAIAVAQKCARDATGVDCSTTSALASGLANRNALDGMSKVHTIDLDKTTRKVSVTTSAKEVGGADNSVSLFFADALGIPTKEVGARASAVWGSPMAGRTAFPLAFSICQVKDNIGGSLQLLQEHGKNSNVDCNYGPSGAAVEGGFGWLVQDLGKCGGTIDLAVSEGGSDPGNNAPGNCGTTLQKWADDINAGRKVTVLLPIFNKVTGTGSGAIYGLVSFAAFEVTGWKFTGSAGLPYEFRSESSTTTGVTSTTACTGECRGIIGKFVKYVSLADGYTLGPVDEYGATIVRMSP